MLHCLKFTILESFRIGHVVKYFKVFVCVENYISCVVVLLVFGGTLLFLFYILRNFSFCFSRNQLSIIPSFISQLQALEVLIASHNRLVSLPEEIGVLDKLMELVCNKSPNPHASYLYLYHTVNSGGI